MVSARENKAALTGMIVERRPHLSLAEYDVVDLRVTKAADVPDLPNLLTSTVGTTIQVTVRRDLLGEAAAGDSLLGFAKRTPDGAMYEPHPEAGTFRVTHARRRTPNSGPESL